MQAYDWEAGDVTLRKRVNFAFLFVLFPTRYGASLSWSISRVVVAEARMRSVVCPVGQRLPARLVSTVAVCGVQDPQSHLPELKCALHRIESCTASVIVMTAHKTLGSRQLTGHLGTAPR